MGKFTQEHITELVKDHIREVTGNTEVCKNQTATVTPGSIIVDGESVSEASNLSRNNGKTLISPERVPLLVQEYVRETFANDEKCRAMGGTLRTQKC